MAKKSPLKEKKLTQSEILQRNREKFPFDMTKNPFFQLLARSVTPKVAKIFGEEALEAGREVKSNPGTPVKFTISGAIVVIKGRVISKIKVNWKLPETEDANILFVDDQGRVYADDPEQMELEFSGRVYELKDSDHEAAEMPKSDDIEEFPSAEEA